MQDFETLFRTYVHPLAPIPTGVAPVLDRLEPFSAIIFDVYGTLLISGAGEIGVHAVHGHRSEAVSTLLKRFGVDRTPEALHEALMQAIQTVHRTSRDRQGIDYPEVDIRRIWQQVFEGDTIVSIEAFALAYELAANPVYPMPGVAELLYAAKMSRTPAGIVSNAQFYTPLALAWFFGTPFEESGFDERFCFFSYREGHAKPSGVMFGRAGKAIAETGIPVQRVLYVGNDMLNDILPARAAGFKTALFAGDKRSLRQRSGDERVKNLTPDLIVTDLRQLISAVAGDHQ